MRLLPLEKSTALTWASLPCPKFEAVSKELGITEKSAKERFRLLSIKMGWKDAPHTPKKPTGVTKRTTAKSGSGKRGGGGKLVTPDIRDDSDEEVKKMDDSDEADKDEGEV
jgi:hypothetical protein